MEITRELLILGLKKQEPLSMEAMELDWIDCYNDATRTIKIKLSYIGS